MKILVKNDTSISNTEFWIDYIRDVCPNCLQDIIMIDTTGDIEIAEWALKQEDFEFVSYETTMPCGKIYNNIIKRFAVDEDVLLTDCFHIPLVGSYKRLMDGLYHKENIFAVGPVANSFQWGQRMLWNCAEQALDWSANCEETWQETLLLQHEVILFGRGVIQGDRTFFDDAKDVRNMVAEKCIREYLAHRRMYICQGSAFWDTRGNWFLDTSLLDSDMLERKFGMRYLNVNGNDWMIGLLEECEDLGDDIKVLEIGCECGGNLFRVKRKYKNARLYGTDLNDSALRFAAEFAEVKVDNVEDRDIDFDGNNFDIIILGDVLEHLSDPLGTLIYCKSLLKEGGRVVASVPNLMNIDVIRGLLNGDFTYGDAGLLDRTHIHFFTYNELVKMFTQDAGFTIEKLSMNGVMNREDEKLAEELTKYGSAKKFMYQAYQYQLVAK